MNNKVSHTILKTDIRDKNDIVVLIDAFYNQVRMDPVLAPVFQQRIPDDAAWPAHLATMYSFWNTLLFAADDYHGNPFHKHLGIEIGAQHFERWIGYFHQTIDLYFSGPMADNAKEKATKMRMIFESKLGITGK
jgi:hemoglobin